MMHAKSRVHVRWSPQTFWRPKWQTPCDGVYVAMMGHSRVPYL